MTIYQCFSQLTNKIGDQQSLKKRDEPEKPYEQENKNETMKTMNFFLTLIMFVLITTLATAQNNYQDVVYLKNGSIIRGVIIEQVLNESIKIESPEGNVFAYQMDEI